MHRSLPKVTIALLLIAVSPAFADPDPTPLAQTSCDKLWDSFLRADATIRQETGKPGFTPLYRAATDAGERIGQQMLAENCPLEDRATFAQGVASLHRFNQMMSK
jgi:hypothetical protein